MSSGGFSVPQQLVHRPSAKSLLAYPLGGSNMIGSLAHGFSGRSLLGNWLVGLSGERYSVYWERCYWGIGLKRFLVRGFREKGCRFEDLDDSCITGCGSWATIFLQRFLLGIFSGGRFQLRRFLGNWLEDYWQTSLLGGWFSGSRPRGICAAKEQRGKFPKGRPGEK